MLPWNVWNWTVFDIETVLTLNWIVIYNCLNNLKWKCFCQLSGVLMLTWIVWNRTDYLHKLVQYCSQHSCVFLTWIVFVMGGRWPYSWCFVGYCRQDLMMMMMIYIKMDLALNNLQRLICHKTQQTNQPTCFTRMALLLNKPRRLIFQRINLMISNLYFSGVFCLFLKIVCSTILIL